MLNANKVIMLLSMVFLQIASMHCMDANYDEEYASWCKDKNTSAIVTHLNLGHIPASNEGIAMLFKYISDSKNMECVEAIESNDELYSAWIRWFKEQRRTKPSKHENKLKRNLRELQDRRRVNEFNINCHN